MNLIDRILVAVDFDDALPSLMARASYLGQRFGAELVLTHALADLEHREDATRRLQRLADDLAGEGARTSPVVVHHGEAFSVVLSTANAFDVNLILMGARDLPLAERLLHGPTANKVMHRAVMPVWLVRPQAGAPVVHRVLCPVDFSAPSDQALRTAIHLARCLAAELEVLHVAPALDSWFSFGTASLGDEYDGLAKGSLSDEQVQHRLHDFVARHLQQFDLGELPATITVRHGKVHEAILQAAEVGQHQLIVMGAFGRGSVLDQFLGNNADRVLRAAPCGVVVVKHQDVFRIAHDHPQKDVHRALEAKIIEANVNELAAYIEQHYQLGRELLEKGLLEDSIVEFRLCLERDHLFCCAYEGIATAYERLGRHRKAEQYRELCRDYRRLVWQQKVQADVRRQHALFTGQPGGVSAV